jgi:hypothetical protein
MANPSPRVINDVYAILTDETDFSPKSPRWLTTTMIHAHLSARYSITDRSVRYALLQLVKEHTVIRERVPYGFRYRAAPLGGSEEGSQADLHAGQIPT